MSRGLVKACHDQEKSEYWVNVVISVSGVVLSTYVQRSYLCL